MTKKIIKTAPKKTTMKKAIPSDIGAQAGYVRSLNSAAEQNNDQGNDAHN